MKVAILGTGMVGQALARGFIGIGYEVVFGTRDPGGESARKAVAQASGAGAATFAEAARQADFAVLATGWPGTENAVRMAGADNLKGKLLIDVTNPLDASQGVPPKLAVGFTTSAGEMIQAWLPQSRVVKAFNTVTAGHMVDPKLAGGPPTMFIAGNDKDAKAQVLDILGKFGWESVDIGGIEGARLLEPLAMLWITYAFQNDHWTHAFKLLGRK